jgi:hyperosmotically inducible periplasmic protein
MPPPCHPKNITLDKGGGMSKALVRSLSLLVILFSGLTLIWAQEPDAKQNPQTPDNTKINQRDRSKSEPTADQQKENRSDRELTRQIRRAIVKDKSLSTYAHNIKIIAQDGMVTLKGPVNTQEEKQAIEAKAAAIAGQGKITNEIEVGSKQASKPSPSHYR